ncbi:MAG: hypothetical protein ACRC7O_09200 [Fimbriiglobus sp.]
MISFQRIASYVGAEPFRPFRVTTASVRTFDIRHPEMIQVGRTTMTIFTHLSASSDEGKERQVEVSLLHTEAVEPLDAVVSPQGALRSGSPPRGSEPIPKTTHEVKMVPPHDILGYLRATPFRPFRIQMTSGKTFDIRHPEMVRVGRGSLIVFSFVSDDPEIYDRWDSVSLMLIENLTHTDVPVA